MNCVRFTNRQNSHCPGVSTWVLPCGGGVARASSRKTFPIAGPPGWVLRGRGGGEPTHRGCLGPSWQWTHSLRFTPMCHCPFTGFLKGDPQPCGMAQPRRPGQIPPQQVPGSHSPPMFLFPWDPLDVGPELSVSSLKLFFCWPFSFLLLTPPPFSASLRDLVPPFPFS